MSEAAHEDDDRLPDQTLLMGPVHQDGPQSWGFSFYAGVPGAGEPGSEWVKASGPDLAMGLREALLRSMRPVYGEVVEYQRAEQLLTAIAMLWPETAAKVGKIRRDLGWAADQEGAP